MGSISTWEHLKVVITEFGAEPYVVVQRATVLCSMEKSMKHNDDANMAVEVMLASGDAIMVLSKGLLYMEGHRLILALQ